MSGALERFVPALAEILADSASWVVLGFAFAGLVHEFVPADRMIRYFGGRNAGSVVRATLVGAFLPMCSCGVIPAGIGLYRTGASLGSTIAFMIATPVINPAAVALSYGLLGMPVTLAYAATGVVGATCVGLLVNAAFAHEERCVVRTTLSEVRDTSLTARLLSALRWGFLELGSDISVYILVGFLLAAVVTAFVPAKAVQQFLGSGELSSLLAMAGVGVPLYVCAVGSIPLVASLLAKGAAPGTAIVFLMAGPATNAAELLAVYKRLGRAAAAVFVTGVFVFSIAGGIVANALVPRGTVHQPPAIEQPGVGSTVIAGYRCSTRSLPAMAVLIGLMGVGVWRRVRASYGGGGARALIRLRARQRGASLRNER